MNIVAIDTATDILSLAVCTTQAATTTRFVYRAEAGLHHGEKMMPALAWLLQQASLPRHAVELLVCCDGPGSFTGLRIGLATAKGLSAATDAPLVTVPTLDALAWPARVWPGIVTAVIDARKSRYYACLYDGARKLTHDLDIDAAALMQQFARYATSEHNVLLTGPGAAQLHAELGDRQRVQCDSRAHEGAAAALLELGQLKAQRGDFAQASHGPNYVRTSDAEMGITTPRRRS